jgi:NADH-quinone oxidoreductase subunit K
LLLSVLLFALGLGGVVLRRNLLFVLISIEIMLNAAGLAFVSAASTTKSADGQVMFMFILAVAAAEVAVGLALLLDLSRRKRTIDADSVRGG